MAAPFGCHLRAFQHFGPLGDHLIHFLAQVHEPWVRRLPQALPHAQEVPGLRNAYEMCMLRREEDS